MTIKSLMPSKKTWKDEGGVIEVEMITYRTVMVERLRDKFQAFQDENKDLPNEVAIFVLCMACTTDVKLLVDEPPLWAKAIQGAFQSPEWRRDPVKIYDELAYAPSETLVQWWAAYNGTRDDALLAPEPLQQPGPLPVQAYIEDGEEDPDKLNFTESSTTTGITTSNVMSLPVPAKRSAGPTRKAK